MHSKRDCTQRHAVEDKEKDFLTMILGGRGAPVQLIVAMEGLSLQNAACGFALRTYGQSKHIGLCARGLQVYARMSSATQRLTLR